MTASTFQVSAALLNSLARRPAPDPAVVARLLSGEFQTKPASFREPIRKAYPDGFGPCGERARQGRVYDRAKSRRRKRMMGGDGRLPNTVRRWFTEGERAVLSVIGSEVKRRGKCELPVEKIAALAGVCIRLVQYTLATASWSSPGTMKLSAEDRPPCLIVIERRKRKTNVIRIVSREWIAWMSYRPAEAPALQATQDGEWSVVDAFAGRTLGMLLGNAGYGCRKAHTSERPFDLGVEAAGVEDGWQRLRLGLPPQRGPGVGERPQRRREHGNE